MTKTNRAAGSKDDKTRVQKRIARKYRALGYDVVERPASDLLPDFMRDTSPDLVARSESDNVVVEIKRGAALEGSNDLVGLAERVSDRPGWRLELVVFADEEEPRRVDFTPLVARSREAAKAGLTDIAFLMLIEVLRAIIRDIALTENMRVKNRTWLEDVSTDRIVRELGFCGVLPEHLVDRCLAVLVIRHDFVHKSSAVGRPARSDFDELAKICEELQVFI